MKFSGNTPVVNESPNWKVPVTSPKTEVAASSTIYKTTGYDQFTYMGTNRDIDEVHVRRLMRKIEREGNLTPERPLVVNEKLEMTDGQHRLEALKRLGQPVYYEVRPGLNEDNVAALNTGNKNWSWRDYANHWSKRGNENYTKFLKMAEVDGRFTVVIVYLTGLTGGGSFGSGGRRQSEFNAGELVVSNFEAGMNLLNQYHELADIAKHDTRDFAIAAYRFMRTPGYRHQRMTEKLAVFGGAVYGNFSIAQYLEALEEIYKA